MNPHTKTLSESQIQNPYKDDHGKPLLRESVVAYIDILGFRDQIKIAVDKADRGKALLTRLRKALDAAFPLIKDKSENTRPLWLVKGFTDNIVIGYPVHLPFDAEPEMGYTFSNLLMFQLMMIIQGFFIRGGLAIGDLYMDDQIVFGEGLIEAFEAEQNLARDPRIVLTESAVEFVNHHLTYYGRAESAPQYRDLLKDPDGQYFINYLQVIIELEANNNVFFDELKKHKKVVESRLKKYVSQPTIWSKYLWVANYHNWFCKQSSHFDKSYEIDLSTIPIEPSRIV